jgi:hypothetical protein
MAHKGHVRSKNVITQLVKVVMLKSTSIPIANRSESTRAQMIMLSRGDDGIKVELAHDVFDLHSVPLADPKLGSNPSNSAV